MSRNYPDLTAEQIENLLDLGNAANVLSIILTGSGAQTDGGSSGEGDGDDFASIYGVLATGCGHRYRDIDEMTLLDFGELCSYWEKNPPVHIMVAAYLGIGKDNNPARPAPAVVQRPAQSLDKPVSPDEAMAVFMGLGHAGSGMIGANIHEGFAVQEMPTTFDDLKRLNGL